MSSAERRAARLVPLVPLGVFLSAIAVALLDFAPMRVPVAPSTAVSVIALMLVLQLFGGFVKCYAARHRRWGALGYLHVVWMSAVSGIVTTILIALVWNTSEGWHPWHLAAYAPPLIGLSIAAGVMLLVGLMGADYPDAAREWTARLGSRFAMLLAAWTLLFGLTIDGPPLVAEVVHRLRASGPRRSSCGSRPR